MVQILLVERVLKHARDGVLYAHRPGNEREKDFFAEKRGMESPCLFLAAVATGSK
jgi:hypothetical protein